MCLTPAQGEPSISCHSVSAWSDILQSATNTPTHCCTMDLSGSVITSGVVGLELMTTNGTGIQEKGTTCQVSTHTDALAEES